MKLILGIDPGLNNTGWGVIKVNGSNISYVASGVIRTKASDVLTSRIQKIYYDVNNIIDEFHPDHFAIEETFVNINPLSSLKLGYARAAAILASANKHIPIYEYSAKYIKKSVVGSGAADKQQILYMIKKLLPTANPKSEDESDAIAVAFCHSNYAEKNYERTDKTKAFNIIT